MNSVLILLLGSCLVKPCLEDALFSDANYVNLTDRISLAPPWPRQDSYYIQLFNNPYTCYLLLDNTLLSYGGEGVRVRRRSRRT